MRAPMTHATTHASSPFHPIRLPSVRKSLNAARIIALAALLVPVLIAPALAACAGTDLRPVLAREAPALAEEATRATAAISNGEHRLWRVTAPNGAISHLYGTMHVSDPAVVALPPEAEAAYDGADIVVIETTDVLDEAAMGASLMARPELMAFTDGTDLTDLMDEAEEAALGAALKERGMTLAAVRSLKPWVLSGLIALPACEDTESFLDMDLARDAVDAGRDVRGLETGVEQFEAMASVPLDVHVDALVGSAMLGGDGLTDAFHTMGRLYAEGAIGAIWPTLQAISTHLAPGTEMDPAAMVAFEEALITTRNRTMATRAAPILAEGDAFIAVGALHLPGEAGLVTLLREAGHAVEPVAR